MNYTILLKEKLQDFENKSHSLKVKLMISLICDIISTLVHDYDYFKSDNNWVYIIERIALQKFT